MGVMFAQQVNAENVLERFMDLVSKKIRHFLLASEKKSGLLKKVQLFGVLHIGREVQVSHLEQPRGWGRRLLASPAIPANLTQGPGMREIRHCLEYQVEPSLQKTPAPTAIRTQLTKRTPER